MRVAAIIEHFRVTPLRVVGLVDNDSCRLAVDRDSSQKMAHLNRTAGLSYAFLKSLGIGPKRVEGLQNRSEIMTKILSEQRVLFLVAEFYGFETGENENGSQMTWLPEREHVGSRIYRGCADFGFPPDSSVLGRPAECICETPETGEPERL